MKKKKVYRKVYKKGTEFNAPLPPLFPMEHKNTSKDVYDAYRRELSKKLAIVAQEVPSSSMTTIKITLKYLWRPNNYRRQIKVKQKTNSTIKVLLGAIPPKNLNYNTHTKMISIKNYEGVTIQYGKETLTAIFSQYTIGKHKEIYLIESDTLQGIEERIVTKSQEITQKIDYALECFSKRFKIVKRFEKPVWSRYEDFIKGEEYIDAIPREVIIHDTHFKKVYGKGVEFKNDKLGDKPTVKLKNYITNRAIENIAPEIIKELSISRELIQGTISQNKSSSDVLHGLSLAHDKWKDNFEKHYGVLDRTEKTLIGIDKSIKKLTDSFEKPRINKISEKYKEIFNHDYW